MTTRFTLLLASAALGSVSAPIAAQDSPHHAPALDPLEATYDGQWEGAWQDEETWRGMWNGTYTGADGEVLQGRYMGTFVGQGRFVTDDGQVLLLDEEHGWHQGAGGYEHQTHRQPHRQLHHRRDPRALGASPDGRLGYTMAEREAWLSDCRLLMADGGGYDGYSDYYRDRDADGGLIGGVLGAVVGGVSGNRIAGRGDRLAGTLIGAGVGGLAGAVIGSLIDGADDDRDRDAAREVDANELWAARYCDAYLRRYEMGSGTAMGYGAMGYQPVMMVAAAHGSRGHRHGPDCTTTVTEEWIEVEQPAPPPRRPARPRPPAPAPEPQGKIEPIS